MKKYFVVSDIHGFYDEMKEALDNAGFDISNPDHYLVCLGDLLDKGNQAREVVDYFYTFPQNKLILIRGNHEDLFDNLLSQFKEKRNGTLVITLDKIKGLKAHINNGTLDTLYQLLGFPIEQPINIEINSENKEYIDKFNSLKDRMINYYETKRFVLTHGWIPTYEYKVEDEYQIETVNDITDNIKTKTYTKYAYNKDWKNATPKEWERARWLNGMELANMGIRVKNKRVVCGHWNVGWGWYNIKHKGFGEYTLFDIYKNTGIVAIDACTAYSHKINCFVIEEEDE